VSDEAEAMGQTESQMETRPILQPNWGTSNAANLRKLPDPILYNFV